MIPALRAAFSEAALEVADELAKLFTEGELPGPWLGDPVSEDFRRPYEQRIMKGPGSAYDCLCAYRDELARAANALSEMESGYRHTDDATARRTGREA